MKSKTCGECKHHKNNRCMLPCFTINHPAENSACHRFELKEPITNGDRIRQMSNKELAEISIYGDRMLDGKIIYRSLFVVDDFFLTKNYAVSAVEAWLNAPAEIEESEG